jgi:hypothetical protein
MAACIVLTDSSETRFAWIEYSWEGTNCLTTKSLFTATANFVLNFDQPIFWYKIMVRLKEQFL